MTEHGITYREHLARIMTDTGTFNKAQLAQWQQRYIPDVSDFAPPTKGRVVYISAPRYLPSYRITGLGRGMYQIDLF